jgi:hypothetical protein
VTRTAGYLLDQLARSDWVKRPQSQRREQSWQVTTEQRLGLARLLEGCPRPSGSSRHCAPDSASATSQRTWLWRLGFPGWDPCLPTASGLAAAFTSRSRWAGNYPMPSEAARAGADRVWTMGWPFWAPPASARGAAPRQRHRLVRRCRGRTARTDQDDFAAVDRAYRDRAAAPVRPGRAHPYRALCCAVCQGGPKLIMQRSGESTTAASPQDQ